MVENILTFSTGLLGLITLLIMIVFKSYKTNRIANGYLLLILFLVSTRYFVNGIFGIYQMSYSNEVRDFVNNLFLIIPPLFLVYFQNLVFNTKRIKFSDLKYFIVLFIFFIFDGLVRKLQYSNLSLNNFYYLFFLSYTLYYMFSIFKILHINIWNREGIIKITLSQNRLLKSWSIFFFSAYLLISTRIFVLILSEFISDSYTYNIGKSYIWASAIVWICVFIKILVFPEILYGYNFLLEKIEENKKSETIIKSFWNVEPNHEITNLNDLQLEKLIKNLILVYIKQIDSLNVANGCFRNPNFSISDFAKILNIKKSHLIYLFKYHSNISFPDYKKIIRIQDSIQLIESNYLSKNTLECLSKKVGFMSYNTFYISFKDVTGVNPIDYNKNFQKSNI